MKNTNVLEIAKTIGELSVVVKFMKNDEMRNVEVETLNEVIERLRDILDTEEHE